MNRRSFMKGAAGAVAVAPVIASVAVAKPNGLRVSSEEGDAGYRPYCIAHGDSKKVRIYLDGIEQKYAVMADETLGAVKRVVLTPSDNFAHDGQNILYEEVYGDVRIAIE
ncbi:twin-arginine translocation signal domain-containing protein [Rhizobium ruizarguesonis]|uniref:twin-arginine translocation signal domain-containing protein n=1 Tax=Rhizobium ruizarguesonis TaxID=2081791 RepID=UPI00042A6FC0|nr:twin-arginine translocation signal domain-containing protein [Rhizobium ruizarguesonis]QJS27469.1 twin-arginine translocation signal domain-containing protein [Rhizobium leguminosarum bv. trifolii TA1]UFW96223.1 twin-arginine translocation signal domain-containing protein [Rhizobium ruizarguesonis]